MIPLILVLFFVSSLALAEEPAPETADEDPQAEEAAEQTPPPPPRNPPLPLSLQRGQALAKQIAQDAFDKSQIHWFREGQKDMYLGLFLPEYGEEPQGYALILHDNQQHPDWPGLIHTLRTQLPAGGWSTLAISLPDYWQLTEAPPREAAKEEVIISETTDSPAQETDGDQEAQASETASEQAEADQDTNDQQDTSAVEVPPVAAPSAPQLSFTQLSVEPDPDEVPKLIRARVNEALDFLKNKDPMPIIIISYGRTATYLAKQVHDFKMKDIAGLVIIDPVALESGDFNVSEDAPGLRIPVLDIVPDLHPRSPPVERKRNAKRNSRKTYEQHRIIGADNQFDGYGMHITKKIRGWAKRVIIDKSRFGYL